jgi:curved DNA-binding protein CbpA/Flp pilus assembly protein TadD
LTLASNLRVPELVAGVDVRTLPLSALEGFVLSRIDGKSSSGDIVALTGLGLEQVIAILDKLVTLGAVRFREDGEVFDPPSRNNLKREGGGTGVHSTPPRRRALSHTPPPHQRRVFSESGVSSPPPELPPHSTRPRSSDSGPPSRSHSLPPSHRPAPQTGRHTQPPPLSGPPTGLYSHTLPPLSGPPTGLFAQPAPTSGSHAQPTSQRPIATSVNAPPVPPVSVIPAGASQRPSGPAQPSPKSVAVSIAPSAAPQPPSYDPRELEEDVDLGIERRRQVLDLYYRLSDIDYYEALGIAYTADKKEIRSAYFALSKVFHPDSMFRKNLGSFKAKMVAVFQFLTEAYETLGKKKGRDEYDAYLRTTKAARMAERALSFEPTNTGIIAETVAAMVVPPAPLVPQISEPASKSSEPPPMPQAHREVSPEARKLAQEVIARRLRGVTTPNTRGAIPTPETPGPTISSPRPPSPEGAVANEVAKGGTQDLLRRLTRTLRDVGQITGSTDHVTRAIRASQAAVERGDLSEATQQAARAASLAPERPELKAEHSKLSAQLSEKLANTYIEQARFEMKHGKWASAALTWTKVCEGRPQDAAAHLHAAQALMKAGGDLRGAQKYAQKAVFLAPTDIESRIMLAQICATAGLKLNARRELEAAAKLDPANEMVKNLLVDLDKA